MTDADKNRKVADACGYDAVPSSTEDNIWHVWDKDVWQGAVGNKVNAYDPLHDANQAWRALDKVCQLEDGGSWDATTIFADGRKTVAVWIYLPGMPRDVGIEGIGPDFCEAAVNAILAAK